MHGLLSASQQVCDVDLSVTGEIFNSDLLVKMVSTSARFLTVKFWFFSL